MASLNSVTLMGNLGRDPELRYTQNQTAVCNFSIATTEYAQDAQGQKTEKTEWHNIVVWSKMAENCGKYLTKGRSVLVQGRLQTTSWDDKDGTKKYKTEVVAQNVQFIGGAKSDDAPRAANGNTNRGPVEETPAGLDDIPF